MRLSYKIKPKFIELTNFHNAVRNVVNFKETSPLRFYVITLPPSMLNFFQHPCAK